MYSSKTKCNVGKCFKRKKKQNKSSNFIKEKGKYKKNGINVSNQFKFLFFYNCSILAIEKDFGAVHNFFLNLCYHESFVSLERQVNQFLKRRFVHCIVFLADM